MLKNQKFSQEFLDYIAEQRELYLCKGAHSVVVRTPQEKLDDLRAYWVEIDALSLDAVKEKLDEQNKTRAWKRAKLQRIQTEHREKFTLSQFSFGYGKASEEHIAEAVRLNTFSEFVEKNIQDELAALAAPLPDAESWKKNKMNILQIQINTIQQDVTIVRTVSTYLGLEL